MRDEDLNDHERRRIQKLIGLVRNKKGLSEEEERYLRELEVYVHDLEVFRKLKSWD